MDKNEKWIMELLDGKEKSMFIDFINANREVNGITTYENFAEGLGLWWKCKGRVFIIVTI